MLRLTLILEFPLILALSYLHGLARGIVALAADAG